MGSMAEWQPAHAGLERWASSFSRTVRGAPPSPTASRLVTTPGGGGGMSTQRRFCCTKRPRRVGDVAAGWALSANSPAIPRSPPRGDPAGCSTRCPDPSPGHGIPYSAASSPSTNVVVVVSSSNRSASWSKASQSTTSKTSCRIAPARVGDICGNIDGSLLIAPSRSSVRCSSKKRRTPRRARGDASNRSAWARSPAVSVSSSRDAASSSSSSGVLSHSA